MRQGLVHQVLVQGVRVQRGVVAVHEEAGETLEAEQTVRSEVGARLVELDQRLGLAQTEPLSLVQSEEMVESLRGNDHVLAGVET